MSYSFDLLRLPKDVDADEAYKKQSEANERKLLEKITGNDDPGPVDPKKEEMKQRLASVLTARHPSLKLFHPDYAALASSKSVDVSEAKRIFRDVELNDEQHRIQIILFDDSAGAALSASESKQSCTAGLRLLWDCLALLEKEGGFSTYDPQVGKVLDLDSDFDVVEKSACG